jgi:hypothetical protein
LAVEFAIGWPIVGGGAFFEDGTTLGTRALAPNGDGAGIVEVLFHVLLFIFTGQMELLTFCLFSKVFVS